MSLEALSKESSRVCKKRAMHGDASQCHVAVALIVWFGSQKRGNRQPYSEIQTANPQGHMEVLLIDFAFSALQFPHVTLRPGGTVIEALGHRSMR